MREEVFLLYKRFILAKEGLTDLLVAKGVVSQKEIAKSPKNTCFLEYLLKKVEERKLERYVKILKKLISIRFRIVEELLFLVEKYLKEMQREDPSGKYALLLKKKVEQAVDRSTSTDVRWGKNSFRARITKDVRRLYQKLRSEKERICRFVCGFEEAEDTEVLTEESLAHYEYYEFVRPASPEELLLIKESLQ